MAMVLLIVLGLYLLLERARKAPWGRVMTASRENEAATRAAGKDVDRLRIEAFVLGAMFMGLGGALTAHYLKFIDPECRRSPDRNVPGLGHADCRRQRQQ